MAALNGDLASGAVAAASGLNPQSTAHAVLRPGLLIPNFITSVELVMDLVIGKELGMQPCNHRKSHTNPHTRNGEFGLGCYPSRNNSSVPFTRNKVGHEGYEVPCELRDKVAESLLAMEADRAIAARGGRSAPPPCLAQALVRVPLFNKRAGETLDVWCEFDRARSEALASASCRSEYLMPLRSEPLFKKNSKALFGLEEHFDGDELPPEDSDHGRAVRAWIEIGAQMEGTHLQLERFLAMNHETSRVYVTLAELLELQKARLPCKALRKAWPRGPDETTYAMTRLTYHVPANLSTLFRRGRQPAGSLELAMAESGMPPQVLWSPPNAFDALPLLLQAGSGPGPSGDGGRGVRSNDAGSDGGGVFWRVWYNFLGLKSFKTFLIPQASMGSAHHDAKDYGNNGRTLWRSASGYVSRWACRAGAAFSDLAPVTLPDTAAPGPPLEHVQPTRCSELETTSLEAKDVDSELEEDSEQSEDESDGGKVHARTHICMCARQGGRRRAQTYIYIYIYGRRRARAVPDLHGARIYILTCMVYTCMCTRLGRS